MLVFVKLQTITPMVKLLLVEIKDSIDSFQNTLKRKKIKSIPLKVSAPFHCSLMKPAAESMKDKIFGTKFDTPFLEIVNNVTAKSENNPEILKNY